MCELRTGGVWTRQVLEAVWRGRGGGLGLVGLGPALALATLRDHRQGQGEPAAVSPSLLRVSTVPLLLASRLVGRSDMMRGLKVFVTFEAEMGMLQPGPQVCRPDPLPQFQCCLWPFHPPVQS